MYYSDEDFCEKVDERPGNVKVFKEYLRKYEMIEPRRQLEDSHIPIFEEVRQFRNEENATWVQSMESVLSKYNASKKDNTALLQEILRVLQRIDSKLN